MLGVLTVTQGPDQGRRHSFGRQQKVTIGRATNASICLTDALASRLHCEASYEGERVVVADTNSASGTRVNGKQIQAPQELRPGDVVVVGQTQLTFQWSDADEKSTEAWQGSKPDQS